IFGSDIYHAQSTGGLQTFLFGPTRDGLYSEQVRASVNSFFEVNGLSPSGDPEILSQSKADFLSSIAVSATKRGARRRRSAATRV
ncbi:unnamed protein product, partial [Amoebophrya sp. A25]